MAARTIERPTEKAYLKILLLNGAPLPDSLMRDSRRSALAVLTNMGMVHYERSREFPQMQRENLVRANLDDPRQLVTTTNFLRSSASRIFGDLFNPRDWDQTMMRSSGDMRPETPISPSLSPYARPMVYVAQRLNGSEEYETALEYIAARTYLHAIQERQNESTGTHGNPRINVQEMADRLDIFGRVQRLDKMPVLDEISQRMHATVIKQEKINAQRIRSVVVKKEEILERIEIENSVDMFDNLIAYSRAHHARQKHVLRGRQMEAFDDIIQTGIRGHKEGYIEAPTGFGKTVLFGEVAAAANVPTVIVVPRKRLVEQTYERLKEFNPDLSVGRMYGDVKEFGHQVTVTTYQTVTADSAEGFYIPFDESKLVILDEVDEATGRERIKAIEKVPEDAFLMGLSATPVKVTGKEYEGSRVAKMMNNEIHTVTLREGVEDGYLSSFSNYIVKVDSDISRVGISEDGIYNEAALESIINTEPHNKATVRFFLKMRSNDRKKYGKRAGPLTTSVYASSVQHSKDLALAFQDAGVKAAAVWGNQNPKEQDEIMRKWTSGEIEIVCSKDLLVRGNDIPRLRLIMNVAPTGSYSVEKQRSGRGLRIDPDNPNKHAIIADFIYQNSNRKNQQVTFAEVAGGAEMYRYVSPGMKHWVGNKRRTGEDNDSSTTGNDEFTIDGLQVVTDVREVMRLVKGIQATRIDDDMTILDTDFPNTQLARRDVFVGKDQDLQAIAETVISEIEAESPELVVQRQNLNWPITVVTDRQLFIDKMVAKGARLKDKTIEPVQEGDTVINTPFLFSLFVGEHQKVAKIKDAVLREMRVEQPALVAQRKNVNRTATVVRDVDEFIRRMLEKGAERKGTPQPTAGKDDLTVTNRWLSDTFVGDAGRLRGIAYEVIAQIEAAHPDKVAWVKINKARVPIVRDKALFMQRMQERKVSLPDAAAIGVLDSDFPVTSTYLLKRFAATWERLRAAKEAVMEEIEAENSDLIAKRKKNITVVTDADIFVRKMQEKGIKLR